MQVVSLQLSEATQQRRRRREAADIEALSLRLRARPLVVEAAAMLAPVPPSGTAARRPDPRLGRQASPEPTGEAAVQQRASAAAAAAAAAKAGPWELGPVVGSDGVARLPLPPFALERSYLGAEIHSSLQQRMHEAATTAARERVQKERAQLLQEARQGKQAAGSEPQQPQQQPPQQQQPQQSSQPSQQQQQQPEEGEVAAAAEAPLAEDALDLERPDCQWEVVCYHNKPQHGESMGGAAAGRCPALA